MIEWQYRQSTGHILRNGSIIAIGYSGHGVGKNNPECEAIADVGPIPKGLYVVGAIRDSANTGPLTIELNPLHHTACGRSDFRIHGDSKAHPGEASHGCIVLSNAVRQLIKFSKFEHDAGGEQTLLEVIA